MRKRSGFYPRTRVDVRNVGAVGNAGGVLVTEAVRVTGLDAEPPGMRVIAREERSHPGAQLRFEDVDGMRITVFATNTAPGGKGSQLAELELRHRRRARCEDRIRCAKDTGLANLPLASFDANRIWCAIVALAGEITAWMQMLALTDQSARRWEPKRLRLRLFTIPAVLARRARTPPAAPRLPRTLGRPRCRRPASPARPGTRTRLTSTPTVPTTRTTPDQWNPATGRRRPRCHTHLQESRLNDRPSLALIVGYRSRCTQRNARSF